VSPAKMAELIEMPFGVRAVDSGKPKELCVRWGAYEHYLGNIIE